MTQTATSGKAALVFRMETTMFRTARPMPHSVRVQRETSLAAAADGILARLFPSPHRPSAA